jgi:CheY-like chemotaxis protein
MTPDAASHPASRNPTAPPAARFRDGRCREDAPGPPDQERILPDHLRPQAPGLGWGDARRRDAEANVVSQGAGPALPAAADASGPAPALAARILVVEDDAPVRDHAVRVVRSLGYEVRAAASGAEALRLLAEDLRCDLLLTDVVMPGMSGGQLAQAVRMLLPGLPVVFVTGHNADAAVEQMRRDGGAILLPKPYRRHALASALRAGLGQP